MRLLRALLITLAALVVLAGAAAWFGPGLLDWNQYRNTIAAFASSTLGQPVRIEGKVTLQLLPQPVLTASRISVTGGGEGVSLTARQLRLRVALGPLLAGRVDPRELMLQSPVLRVPWPLRGGLLPAWPAWLSRLSASIADGQLIVGNATVSGIDATMNTDPVSGALMLAGAARFSGQAWRFTTRLGEPGGDGASVVQATLDGQGKVQNTGGRFSGRIEADGSVTGTITGRGGDLSQLLPAPAVPWRAEGRLTEAGGLTAADNLAIQINGSPARGAVALRLSSSPRLDVALVASRLDLDAWLPVLLKGPPTEISTGIDLSAEAATLGGGTLRHLRGAVDLGPDGATVREASVVLPGDATLHLAGRIIRDHAGPPRFQGQGSLGAPDFRTTLQWLRGAGAMPATALPPQVMRTLSLSAKVMADKDGVTLDDATGTLDGTEFSGTLGAAFGTHPALRATLALDRLVLDPWLPDQLPKLTDVPGLFAGFDLALDLRAQHAQWRGIGADALQIDAAAAAGHVTVKRLSATAKGVVTTLSGTIGPGGRVVDGKLGIEAAEATPLSLLLPQRWRATPALWQGPIRLSLQASGPPEALALRVGLDLADARLDATPTLNLRTGGWAGLVTLRHPGATRLLRTLGMRGTSDWLGEGSLSLIAELRAKPQQIALPRIEIIAGGLRASGQLTVERPKADTPLITGRIAADALPMPMLAGNDPLPLYLLHGWRAGVQLTAGEVLAEDAPVMRDVSARLDLHDDRLRVGELIGKINGGDLAAQAELDAAPSPPALSVRATVSNIALPGVDPSRKLDIGTGKLNGTAEVTAKGFSPAAMLATLTGQGHVSVRDGAVSGFDLAAVDSALRGDAPAHVQADIHQAVSGGATAFQLLDAALRVQHGIVTLQDARMTAASGNAAIAGTIDVPGRAADLQATATPAVKGAPEIRLGIAGPIEDPQIAPELTELARWLAARPAAAAGNGTAVP